MEPVDSEIASPVFDMASFLQFEAEVEQQQAVLLTQPQVVSPILSPNLGAIEEEAEDSEFCIKMKLGLIEILGR